MNWIEGNGVLTCGDYTGSRRPCKKFYLIHKTRGMLAQGTQAHCKEFAAKDSGMDKIERARGRTFNSFVALASA